MTVTVDLLIVNSTIITASDVLPNQEIAIRDEKILLLGQNIGFMCSASRIIDAQGGFVTPGGIDSHVHLAQDNAPSGDTFETGTRSAIAGGTTTIIAFAVQKRADTSVLPVIEQYHARASGQAYCDYGFHLILTNPTPQVMSHELPQLVVQGITSVKLYMTYEPLKLGDLELLNVMASTRKLGMTTMIHAENADIIAYLTQQLETSNRTSPFAHALSRPPISEDEATYRAICLSDVTSTPILLVHMSSKIAASHVRHAQTKLLPIHAETCPHYLYLTASALNQQGFEGAKCVCAPALREDPADLEAMWRGLANGTFTVLSSDHAPDSFDHPQGKKAALEPQNLLPNGDSTFRRIPNGLPGVETRMAFLMSEGVMKGRLNIHKFVELTSTNHAKLYGLSDRKGTIAPGFDADLVIWYPMPGKREKVMDTFKLKNDMLHHGIDYTPFEGLEFSNWPRYTILRGKVCWDRDSEGLVGEMGEGRFLKRGKSTLT